jgi:phosphatidate cytidylyltransferase
MASKIGPRFNKKLASEISPNKTIGGAIINWITTCIVCLSLKYFINYAILDCLILGTIISTFAQIGDLTISSFKRDLGIKHSGTMFLEYGGILDRMDAFIFSAPAAYYVLYLIN